MGAEPTKTDWLRRIAAHCRNNGIIEANRLKQVARPADYAKELSAAANLLVIAREISALADHDDLATLLGIE